MTAREIARDFISTMNPSGWDGVGQKPDDFNMETKTYTIDDFFNYEIDIFYYKNDETDCVVMLELRREDNGELIYVIDSQRINSEDTIEYLIRLLIDDL